MVYQIKTSAALSETTARRPRHVDNGLNRDWNITLGRKMNYNKYFEEYQLPEFHVNMTGLAIHIALVFWN